MAVRQFLASRWSSLGCRLFLFGRCGKMEELTDILKEATRRISSSYFQVKIANGDSIYRERVYCYELYHQLRCLWPACTDFYLNGELDKSAHPILKSLGADYAKPDFLIHKPGRMAGNHAIIEVKTSKAQTDGIQKDLDTLALFLTSVQYKRAIYLLFGYDLERAVEKVFQVAKNIECPPSIELWLHSKPGHAAILSQHCIRSASPPEYFDY